MNLYQLIVDLIGPLPTEFSFVYIILTLVLAMLILSFLFSVFYIPLNLVKGKWYVTCNKIYVWANR